MNLSIVKDNLKKHVGAKISIKYNLGRNKYEEYEAEIKELYDYVFLVDTDYGMKSFTYIDVITKVIRIDY